MELPVDRILSSDTFQKLRGKELDKGIRLVKDLSKQEIGSLQDMIGENGFMTDLLTRQDLVPELSYTAFEGETPEGILIANREEVRMSILTEYDEAKMMEYFKEEGREEGISQMIENMLRRGKTVDEIVDFCDYPRKFVEEIKEKMELRV